MAQAVSEDTAAEPVSSSPSSDPDEEGMTMLEHLEELRQRMIRSAFAFIFGLIASALPLPPDWSRNLTWIVVEAIIRPVGFENVIGIRPVEVFFAYFQVAMFIGLALAMPILVYQAMAFVLPALHEDEKKYLYLAAPGAMVSFLAGASFGYFVVVPAAVGFLFGFGQGVIQQKWAFAEYLDTFSTLIFWMGASFEMPLLIFFLCKLHVVDVDRLRSFRKYALVGAFCIGALITPTPDPFNQTLVSVPLYLLFEIGILLARLA